MYLNFNDALTVSHKATKGSRKYSLELVTVLVISQTGLGEGEKMYTCKECLFLCRNGGGEGEDVLSSGIKMNICPGFTSQSNFK